ncbi:hypothetical protein IFM89_000577 [Coptis chinensis]|uniref:Uncharacterized protein n=1 Tax=Coptis chinensis TaxID=261450 RepID=A0A835MGT8_9MAGN|nr:hypothetical protein IFM89_000577 [Coptis chinensis]
MMSLILKLKHVLQHSNIRLTWDEDEPNRKSLRRNITDKHVGELTSTFCLKFKCKFCLMECYLLTSKKAWDYLMFLLLIKNYGTMENLDEALPLYISTSCLDLICGLNPFVLSVFLYASILPQAVPCHFHSTSNSFHSLKLIN